MSPYECPVGLLELTAFTKGITCPFISFLIQFFQIICIFFRTNNLQHVLPQMYLKMNYIVTLGSFSLHHAMLVFDIRIQELDIEVNL